MAEAPADDGAAAPLVGGVPVPVLSNHPRCPNGPFSRADRFFDPRGLTDTPGPCYTVGSLFDEHAQAPLYKKDYDNPKATQEYIRDRNTMPTPNKDRSSWMIGVTRNDLPYYSLHLGHSRVVGPSYYSPNVNVVSETPPRNVFAKNQRFTSLTHRYVSKEHNLANLCTAGPGPRYYPPVGAIDLNTSSAPEYSFGGKNITNRHSFLNAEVRGSVLYAARPATGSPPSNLSPASYRPSHLVDSTYPVPPKPLWAKGDRFKDLHTRFITKGHTRAKVGIHSPGPQYYAHNGEINEFVKKKANTPKGKWSP